jgi:hypothetical protein
MAEASTMALPLLTIILLLFNPATELVPPLAIATVPVTLDAVPLALPVKLAVIVPAEKLPEPSLFTIAEAVLASVAALANNVAA